MQLQYSKPQKAAKLYKLYVFDHVPVQETAKVETAVWCNIPFLTLTGTQGWVKGLFAASPRKCSALPTVLVSHTFTAQRSVGLFAKHKGNDDHQNSLFQRHEMLRNRVLSTSTRLK